MTSVHALIEVVQSLLCQGKAIMPRQTASEDRQYRNIPKGTNFGPIGFVHRKHDLQPIYDASIT